MGGLYILMVVLVSLIDVMFRPFIITCAHLAFSGARIHSNSTAEMTAMFQALSFLGPHGPVIHDEQLCI